MSKTRPVNRPTKKPSASSNKPKKTSTAYSNARKTSRKTSRPRGKKPIKQSWFKRFIKRLFVICFVLGLIAAIPLSVWVWWLDKELVQHFEGQKWQVPAEVYSAPTLLRSGDQWRKQDLEKSLQQAGYRFGRNSQEIGWAARSLTKVSAHLRSFSDHTGDYPAQRRIFSFPDGHLEIKTVAGRKVSSAILEPQLIGHLYGGNSESRILLTYDEIPKHLIDTLLAVEDRDFYEHIGISFTGIARAFWVNLQAGSRRQGGSTLTQQLIKNMYLSSERSYSRKIREVIMALLMEYRFSKQEILTAYVNEVYLAQHGNKAIHGFAAASQHFFARPLKELSIDEMATLVGTVKGPSLYNPKRHPKRAKERRDVVLNLLYQQDFITEAQYKVSLSKALKTRTQAGTRSLYGDFLDLVAFQLSRDFDKKTLATQSLKIYTGLDTRVQQAVLESMTSQVKSLKRAKKGLKDLQGAIVVTDAHNGQVKAILGSSDGRYTGFNRALAAVRPIGSLVKPPIYLEALANQSFTWLTLLEDDETRFEVGGELWEPENFDHKYHGNVPMYQALAKSYNLATLDLAYRIGFEEVGDALRRLGVEREFTMFPAVALGALELSPFEVARLYQPIASAGESSQLGIVASVLTSEGGVLKEFSQDTRVPYSKAALATLRDGMKLSAQIGTTRAAQAALPNLVFAAKTGTTNQQRDSWYQGITADYSTTIWLGADDNHPLSITGSSGAQKVWIEMMKRLNPTSLEEVLPHGSEYFQVSRNEFKLAADRCDDKVTLSFLEGTAPEDKNFCIWPF
ncbi:penicillin-binding protein [Marinomonas sp. SBI22]|uniref:transglycosylase domain-containing protein n=1 Tax=unclassified Marinomonas TaxID=196814 RepID=UPI0007AFCBA4|nr:MULTISPECIES: transglycosylase domain-containing protein [unclassified Marinomonas]KZM40796.1 penicillin-binding protein [Marinomonas sp. SBI8L]KZM46019.1 penicillin-binding protein [Marinomonas sp. SBI22]